MTAVKPEEALKVTRADECDICGRVAARHVWVIGTGLVCPVSAVTYRRKLIEHSPTPARNEVLEEAARRVEALNGLIWARVAADAIRTLKTPTPEPTNPAGVSGVAEELEALAVEMREQNTPYTERHQRAEELALRAARVIRTPAPDAGLREALEKLADVVERLTDAIERQEHDIGGESVAAVLPDLGPAYDHARATLARVRQGKPK